MARFLLVLLVLAGEARAEEVAIAPLSGKSGKACTKTIAEVASEIATVVPWSAKKVPSTWRALSAWLDARGHDIGVSVVILGSVGKNSVVLEAYDLRRVKLIGLKSVVVGKGCKLAAGQRELVIDFVQEVLGLEKKEQAPLALLMPDEPAPRAEEPESSMQAAQPPVQQAPPPREDKPPLIDGRDLAPMPSEPSEFIQVHPRDVPKPRPKAEPQPAAIATQAGAEVDLAMVSRDFTFSEARSPNLRGYAAKMPVPGLSISAHPLAEVGYEELAPLFVEARFRHSFAVQSSRPEGGPEYATYYAEVGARAGWRFQIPSLDASVVPSLGYHRTSFSLGAADGGLRELDLPRVAYSSLEVRAAAEMKVIAPLSIEASLAYLAVLSAGEVFSDRFFSRGSAFGLELGAGARYLLMPGLYAVGGLSLRAYSLSLDAQPTDPRVAGGASDTAFMLRSGIRAEL